MNLTILIKYDKLKSRLATTRKGAISKNMSLFLFCIGVMFFYTGEARASYPGQEYSENLVQVGDTSQLGNIADTGANTRNLTQSNGFQVKENISNFDTVSIFMSTTATCATTSVVMRIYDSSCVLQYTSASSTLPCGSGSNAYYRNMFFRFPSPISITNTASTTFMVTSATSSAGTYILAWNNTPLPNDRNLINAGACTPYVTTTYRMPVKFWLYTPCTSSGGDCSFSTSSDISVITLNTESYSSSTGTTTATYQYYAPFILYFFFFTIVVGIIVTVKMYL